MTEPRRAAAGSRRPYGGDPGRYPGSRPRSPGPTRRVWGGLPGRTGVCIVIGSAALGALATALTRSGPGLLLGVFVIAGTLAGALAIRPRAVYLVIPAPALAYAVAAILAGLIHDRPAADSGTTLAAANATQWIASGFLTMTATTVLVIVIAAVRWRQRPGRGQRDPGYRDRRDPDYRDRRDAGYRDQRDPGYPGRRGPGYRASDSGGYRRRAP